MTAERFARLIISDEVNGRIRGYRARLPELQQLKAQADHLRALIAATPAPAQAAAPSFADGGSPAVPAPPTRDLKAQLREVQAKARDITSLKTGLPVLMYQATFDETVSKRGYRGRWRKQSAARLNGLFMMDVDHVENPRALFASWGIKKTTSFVEGDKKTTETTGTTSCGEIEKEVGTRRVASATMPASVNRGDGRDTSRPYNEAKPTAQQEKKLSELSELSSRILLVHITPSGHGLRIVATA